MTPYPPLVDGDTKRRVSVSWHYLGRREVGFPDAAYDAAVYAELVAILKPAGVPVMNYIPDYTPPWMYVAAVILGTPTVGYRGNVAGHTPDPIFVNDNPMRFNTVTVGWDRDPVWVAARIAHEMGHIFRKPDVNDLTEPGHEDEKVDGLPNVMRADGRIRGGRFSKARIGRIDDAHARFLGGWRFGFYDDGQPRVGWFKTANRLANSLPPIPPDAGTGASGTPPG